jgi:hypothetical protein
MIVDREAILTATLSAWRRGRHAWGLGDCLISVADYAGALTGTDPALPWRGTYRTEEEARAIVAAAGGAVMLLGGALTGAGLMRVSAPLRGDCVVVRFAGVEIGGIWLGRRAALRMVNGATEVRAPVLAAWRA